MFVAEINDEIIAYAGYHIGHLILNDKHYKKWMPFSARVRRQFSGYHWHMAFEKDLTFVASRILSMSTKETPRRLRKLTFHATLYDNQTLLTWLKAVLTQTLRQDFVSPHAIALLILAFENDTKLESLQKSDLWTRYNLRSSGDFMHACFHFMVRCCPQKLYWYISKGLVFASSLMGSQWSRLILQLDIHDMSKLISALELLPQDAKTEKNRCKDIFYQWSTLGYVPPQHQQNEDFCKVPPLIRPRNQHDYNWHWDAYLRNPESDNEDGTDSDSDSDEE